MLTFNFLLNAGLGQFCTWSGIQEPKKAYGIIAAFSTAQDPLYV
jgi:hypothetical protein